MNLPKSWTIVPIGRIVELNPARPAKGAYQGNMHVAFVPMAAVDAIAGEIAFQEKREFSSCLKGYTSFANGDVIFAKITPCMENGKSAIARDLSNGIGFGSTEFHVLRPTPVVNNKYLHHFIRQVRFRKPAEREMRGAVGQKRVPPEFIDHHPFPLPPLAEQHRIVAKIEELFSDLDAGTASLKKAKEQLKTYRQAVLKWAFEGKLTKEWRRQNKPEPASELLKRIKTE